MARYFSTFPMFRLLRRFLLIALATLLTGLVALSLIAYFFQDRVKAELVAELNTHLTAPLHQNGIELTLIKRFPQASLRIREAYMQEVRTDGQAADTLFYAKDLYLEFSLFSLFTGDHTVRELHGSGVKLYPGLDANGNGNWAIWKSEPGTEDSGTGTDIALRRVTFDGLDGRFRDDRSAMEVAFHSDKLALGGRFREARSKLTTKGDLWLRHWTDAQGTVLADRRAVVQLAMAFGPELNGFHLEKGELLFGKTPLNVTLSVTPEAGGHHLELRANGFGLDLASVVQLLPDNLRQAMRRYGMAGNADLALHYAGPLEAPGPALSLGMKLRDGRFTELASGTVFRKVHGEFSADFTPNWSPAKLVVRQFSATSASGTVAGGLELHGLKNADLVADLRADLGLADLFRFVGLDTLEQVAGNMKAQAHIQGKLRDVEQFKPADLHGLAITGSVKLTDASLKMKGLRHRVSELNAEMALEGNDALVHGLRFNLQGNAMELTGTLRNLMPYALFKDQRLIIDAKGSSPSIDLASLLAKRTGSAQPATQPGAAGAYAFTLPAQIDLDLQAAIGELRMETFRATGITCNLRMQGQHLVLEPLRFATAEGTVKGSLKLDARPAPAYPLTITADLTGINVAALFAEFQDFGQSFITSAHVKGHGDARLTFTAPLRPDFSLDQERLHCVADVTLLNGELNNHSSLMQVADHLQRNKLTAALVDTDALRKQFKHVTFARLENRIEIKDRKVYLPLMTVSSSVMDMEVSGVHGFDGEVDDHLNFRLGDLFRTAQSSSDEFGPIIDDGTGLRIFLHMYGTTDNLQFGNDGAMAATRRKERMKAETAELKGILKGIVTGDGSAQAEPETPRTQDRITVDFGAGQTTQAQPAPKPRKGLGRLLQKEENEEPAVIIGVE